MKEQIEHIIKLMTEFDEMGFVPTTTVPCSPEAYAIKWRDAMAKDLIDLRKQSEWISVEDRMPPALGKVLVYSPILGVYMTCYTAYSPSFAEPSVTHWMPIPEPPEMKGGE